ncbi:hypothetical protein BDV25DRAFT_167218 [Aspergillus avenaceus]|uniref:Nitrogen regulatory protein areA GATA-like domain-containing protein n=1 Tax=Aspergillus avenaceus TaxID=36643 RepID=A0A5N6TD13_ASPAV|nr:hypothetical protein BDV25DRAFT_167218 [Aspergillus avenaceus]
MKMAAVITTEERPIQITFDSLRYPTAQRYYLEDSDSDTIKYQSPIHDCSQRSCPDFVYSAPSSFPPSPDFIQTSSGRLPPTPASLSSLSLCISDEQDDDGDGDEILLPSYDAGPYASKLPEPPSEISAESFTEMQRSADDSSIEEEPSRHVDYLSHEWREEDIWASWRYVAAQRERYDNGVRLENASWRTWTKLKLNLGTVSPEALNWLKDHDVTWLYGPLKTSSKHKLPPNASPPPSRLETPTCSVDRKPILKKRTASETILQRSLSQHTLLQHAGAILQAQEAGVSRSRTSFYRYYPSHIRQTPSQSSDGFPQTSLNVTPTNGSSDIGSPYDKRHIHFNNEVVQCIAVEVKDDEEDEWLANVNDDSSEEGIVMMKHRSSQASINDKTDMSRNGLNSESKTIAPLPPTTLKFRSDTPEPPASSIINRWSGYFSPYSSSDASVVDSDPEANFFLDEGDNEFEFNWEPTRCPPEPTTRTRPWFVNPEDDAELDKQPPSSSVLPLDEAEPANASILERVVDAVNTAKDIAHVIWNVGWRR